MPALQNKIALITGAARGIGAAITKAFADEGAAVIVTDIDDTEGRTTAAAIGADYLHLDVSSEVDWASALEAHPKLDILVNNAGITRDNIFMRMKDEEWDQVLEVNLSSGFRLCRAAIKGMMKRRSGRL